MLWYYAVWECKLSKMDYNLQGSNCGQLQIQSNSVSCAWGPEIQRPCDSVWLLQHGPCHRGSGALPQHSWFFFPPWFCKPAGCCYLFPLHTRGGAYPTKAWLFSWPSALLILSVANFIREYRAWFLIEFCTGISRINWMEYLQDHGRAWSVLSVPWILGKAEGRALCFPRNYCYRVYRNFAQNKTHINKPKEVILSSPFV